MVPARRLPAGKPLAPAAILRAPRDTITNFGASLASAGDILLIGGRLADHPFTALYRVGAGRAVRERFLLGTVGHHGPVLATDGARVAVGQPASARARGFVCVYRLGLASFHLQLESILEARPDDPEPAHFGERMAIGQDLLVVGHAGSVAVYRHSVIGWLSAGMLAPPLAYPWNPWFGHSLGVVSGRVFVGNPVELNGHRAGAGRVFVYRRQSDRLEFESVLQGEGLEQGREASPRPGFGASIHVYGKHVLITAPHELLGAGRVQSSVYVYRIQRGALIRLARIAVPSCQAGACLAGDRLLVLGDALYVFARRGDSFEALGIQALEPAGATAIRARGPLIFFGNPHEQGSVAMHFATRL